MKAFISQPMGGLSDDEIVIIRDSIWRTIKEKHGEDCEIIDSYFEGTRMSPLECLGESIKLLEQADVAYFAPGWDEARGCLIEHGVAELYNIPRVELEDI